MLFARSHIVVEALLVLRYIATVGCGDTKLARLGG